MSSGSYRILNELVDASLTDLLTQYSLEAEATSVPSADSCIRCAAVLGFSGGEIRGVVGLVAEYPVLEQSRSTLLGSAGTRDEVHDWAGELSNQLVGRLKNRLFKYGQTIQLATPMVLRGLQLDICSTEHPPVVHSFRTQHGLIWVWLDAELAPNLCLEPVPETEADADDSSLIEGDMMMF